MVRDTVLYGTAIAATVSGYKIFTKWNRGEPVVNLIFTWAMNMVIATILMIMIWGMILGKDVYNYEYISATISMAKEMHSAAIVMGVAVAIVAIIHIYHRHNAGDDVTELIYRWVASLFFLFTFGQIIEILL